MIKAQPTEVRTQAAVLIPNLLQRQNFKTMAKSSEGSNNLDAVMAKFRELIKNERNPIVKQQLRDRLAAIIADAGYE